MLGLTTLALFWVDVSLTMMEAEPEAACLVVRLAVPSLQENQILNSATTLLLGLSCGALYLIRKDYPAPKPSKLDGVVNAVLIVFALVYGLLGVWGVIQLFA